MYSIKTNRTLVASVVMSQEVAILCTTNGWVQGRAAKRSVPYERIVMPTFN